MHSSSGLRGCARSLTPVASSHFFEDVGYRHEPFQHCPERPEFVNKCWCNPRTCPPSLSPALGRIQQSLNLPAPARDIYFRGYFW
jgi:hypothetical protein